MRLIIPIPVEVVRESIFMNYSGHFGKTNYVFVGELLSVSDFFNGLYIMI